ncbi:MAG: hypothetical protein HRU15_04030 [Planctomycetes bacterium]|nr:hypothetical protein [Planctomycetota bacterium]
MRNWWQRQNHARHEAFILGALAAICLLSLALRSEQSTGKQNGRTLLAQTHSYHIEGEFADYSLLFENSIALIGDPRFKAIGRLNESEAEHILETLHQTHIVREFGKQQFNQQQKQAYGFDHPVRISCPGQNTWIVASAADGHGYARDQNNNLFQLDRDLAAQINRQPQALRSSTLGIPSNIQQIDFQAEWTLLNAYDLWWIQESDKARPAEQAACSDWLDILMKSRAVSFCDNQQQQSSPFIHVQGTDKHGRRNIGIFDRGPAPGSDVHRIIERKEQIGDHILIESFIISLNPRYIRMPMSALASKKMFPIPFERADSLRINELQLNHKDKQWYVNKNQPAEQQQIENFFNQLQRIPASTELGENIGHIYIAEAQIDIRHSAELNAYSKYKNFMFADKRLFPLSSKATGQQINALVIQAKDDVPEIFSQADDGSWDVDPETNAATSEFIAALNAARVSKWTNSYQSQNMWTSTLTVAIGDTRIILHKAEDGLIGIKARNVQGYLDHDSAADLFGTED